MKVYVDELPKSCAECKFLGVFGWCNYLKDGVCDEIKNNKRHILCPLQSLADHTKQVRKEVCEEIRQKIKDNIGVVLGDYNYYTLKYNEIEVCKIDIINDILDQTQGEKQ